MGKTWPTVYEWVKLVNEASVKFGKEFNLGPKITDYMSSVGFIDIREKFVKIPIGPWAKGKKNKEMGVLQREHICDCVVRFPQHISSEPTGMSKRPQPRTNNCKGFLHAEIVHSSAWLEYRRQAQALPIVLARVGTNH